MCCMAVEMLASWDSVQEGIVLQTVCDGTLAMQRRGHAHAKSEGDAICSAAYKACTALFFFSVE